MNLGSERHYEQQVQTLEYSVTKVPVLHVLFGKATCIIYDKDTILKENCKKYIFVCMHTHTHKYKCIDTCFTFTWCNKWWPCSILQTYNIFWSIRKMTFGTNDNYVCWIYKTPIMQHCCIWYRTSSIINIQSWTGYWNSNIYFLMLV